MFVRKNNRDNVCYTLIEQNWWIKYQELVKVYYNSNNNNILIRRIYIAKDSINASDMIYLFVKSGLWEDYGKDGKIEHYEYKPFQLIDHDSLNILTKNYFNN